MLIYAGDLIKSKTDVATCCLKNDAVEAASALKQYFNELFVFTAKEARHIDPDDLRARIFTLVNCEDKAEKGVMNDHFAEIHKISTSPGILNYLLHNSLVGYLNYGLLKAFKLEAKSKMLNSWINGYEKNYRFFLQSFSWSEICKALRKVPWSCPVGLPDFSVHLENILSAGKSTAYQWKELLVKHASTDWPSWLIVGEIKEECIVIRYCVWPRFTESVAKDLMDDKFISALQENGATIKSISDQLQNEFQRQQVKPQYVSLLCQSICMSVF